MIHWLDDYTKEAHMYLVANTSSFSLVRQPILKEIYTILSEQAAAAAAEPRDRRPCWELPSHPPLPGLLSFEVVGRGREEWLFLFFFFGGRGGILWLTGNFLSSRTNVAGKLHQSPPQRFDYCQKKHKIKSVPCWRATLLSRRSSDLRTDPRPDLSECPLTEAGRRVTTVVARRCLQTPDITPGTTFLFCFVLFCIFVFIPFFDFYERFHWSTLRHQLGNYFC